MTGEPEWGGADPRVIMLCGFGRSGSTVLGDILGSVPGVVHVGELVRLPLRLAQGGVCDCGLPLRSCPVWAEAALLFEHPAVATRRFGTKMVWPDTPGFLSNVYRAIAHGSGASVIIDGSKLPGFVEYAVDQPIGPPGITHLVRDPRAVVHSRQRRGRLRKLAGRSAMRRAVSITMDAVRWQVVNRRARRLAAGSAQAMTLRYEDFAQDPDTVLRSLGEAFSIPTPAAHDGVFECSERHSVWGNRGRRPGPIRVTADDRWRTDMPRGVRWAVGAFSQPEARRYGYPAGAG